MTEITLITFAASAIKDLEDMLAFYEGAPDVGKRLAGEIIANVELLGAYPPSRHLVTEFHLEHLFEILHPPFRIVYRYDPNKVRIVRIWRSEKLLRMP